MFLWWRQQFSARNSPSQCGLKLEADGRGLSRVCRVCCCWKSCWLASPSDSRALLRFPFRQRARWRRPSPPASTPRCFALGAAGLAESSGELRVRGVFLVWPDAGAGRSHRRHGDERRAEVHAQRSWRTGLPSPSASVLWKTVVTQIPLKCISINELVFKGSPSAADGSRPNRLSQTALVHRGRGARKIKSDLDVTLVNSTLVTGRRKKLFVERRMLQGALFIQHDHSSFLHTPLLRSAHSFLCFIS